MFTISWFDSVLVGSATEHRGLWPAASVIALTPDSMSTTNCALPHSENFLTRRPGPPRPDGERQSRGVGAGLITG
jgi:hypothetical protein